MFQKEEQLASELDVANQTRPGALEGEQSCEEGSIKLRDHHQ